MRCRTIGCSRRWPGSAGRRRAGATPGARDDARARPRDDPPAATLDDLPAIRAILAAHGNDGPVVIADIVGPYVRHLIARGRARVAIDRRRGRRVRRGDRRRPVGPSRRPVRPARTGSARGSAGRCSTALFERRGRTGRRSRPRIRGRCRSTSGRGCRRCGPASTSRARPIACRRRRRPPDASPRPPTGSRRSSATGRASTGRRPRVLGDACPTATPSSSATATRSSRSATAASARRLRSGSSIGWSSTPTPASIRCRTLAAIARAGRGGVVLGCLSRARTRCSGRCSTLGFRIADRDQFMASDPAISSTRPADPEPGNALGSRTQAGASTGGGKPRRSVAVEEEHGARGRVERRVRRDRRTSPGASARQPAMTGVGFSIGTPTMLPHSVHEPS